MSIPESPSEIARTRAKVSQILQHVSHMENPAVPELSFTPDFMVNFENQLIFLEIASMPREADADWKTLRLIEHLFEVKLFYGNKSNFNLIIMNKDGWKPYCIELIENFCDKVIYQGDLQSTREIYTTPKVSNFELWDLEREFERSRYRKFDDAFLGKFEYRDARESTIEYEFYNRMLKRGLFLERDYSVTNLKNYYLGRAMDLRFYFDFVVNHKIVEIKSFRKITATVLQNLLIKSRFIRYQKEDDRIRRAQMLISRMILFVNGDLSGPRHDRFRYLRMLTNAGWDVYPYADFLNDRIEGFLDD
jgi:hypothetical protein